MLTSYYTTSMQSSGIFMGSYTMMEPPGRGESDHRDNQGHNALSKRDPSTDAPLKHSALDRDIPIRLKALRMSLGLSAAMMDRQAGFTIGTVGRLERGDLRVYANHLYRISSATGVAISYFYDQLDCPDTAANTNTQDLEKQRLLLAYMNIKDPTLKRDVFELVETLAAESKAKRR